MNKLLISSGRTALCTAAPKNKNTIERSAQKPFALHRPRLKHPATVWRAFILLLFPVISFGQWIDMSNAPTTLEPGKRHQITLNRGAPYNGVVQLQLFNPNWQIVDTDWKQASGSGATTFTIDIPANAPATGGYIWQGLVYNNQWVKRNERFRYGVSVTPPPRNNGEWLPPGNWALDWNDEFSGTGLPRKWYPMLGYNPDEFNNNSEKALRWSGDTPNTAWMYSTKSGNHWLNGSGQLVMRIVSDKTQFNIHGPRAKAAYLLSGFPKNWDSSEPYNVKWGGKFVSPKNSPLYISARVKSNQVVGHSTWFAFWLFSETRAYNNNPKDGTEVDVIEIAKGAPNYMRKSFNVANHWNLDGGSEALQFNNASNPRSTSLVDVTDSNYHVYGIEWTPTRMKCYVDGKHYYTFTSNVPSDPKDMMMMLTLEFEKNAWDPNQGDGRFSGPYISDNANQREMSRAQIDYVRVYRKQ